MRVIKDEKENTKIALVKSRFFKSISRAISRRSLSIAGREAIILVDEYNFNPLKSPVITFRMLPETRTTKKARYNSPQLLSGRLRKLKKGL
jgi:hypothetical protein